MQEKSQRLWPKKKALVDKMESMVSIDETGFLAATIASGKKSLESMKERDVRMARKNVQWSSYQCQEQNAYNY